MEIVKLQIPLGFIQARTCLTWHEVLFGVANELFSPEAAAELAAQQLGKEADTSSALVDLVILDENESRVPLIQRLAAAEPEEHSGEPQQKWLYLVLAWMFAHKDSYSDPFGAVEAVYADFGYPECISSLVRYMPMLDADLGSKQANEQRLYDKWKAFVDEASVEYEKT